MKHLLTILFTYFLLCPNAQNLVLNPSFEKKSKQYNPFEIQEFIFNRCVDWKEINTCDYYWDGNVNGIQNSISYLFEGHKGSCYAGVFIRNSPKNCEREYLIDQFNTTLIKDSLYQIRIFVNFHNRYPCTLNNIEVIVTSDSIDQVFSASPVITRLMPIKKTSNNAEWIEHSSTYRALGKEDKIFIGFFSKTINYSSKRKCKFGSLLLVDDVSVTPLFESRKVESEKSKENKTIPKILNYPKEVQIYFDFDSFEITREEISELDSLVLLLKKEKTLKIKLNGSSDTSGTEQYNSQLSKNRVNSVLDYLISHGIDKQRIIALNTFGVAFFQIYV